MRADARRRRRSCFALLLLAMLSACHQVDSPTAPRSPERSGGRVERGERRAVLEARSVRVQDGDSFIARTENGDFLTIRLSGVDAPERNQPFADHSRESLRFLLEHRRLQIRIAKYDAYDRAVAQVFSLGDGAPVDVGLVQLENGLAWFFRRYREDLPPQSRDPYALAEQAARAARRGLWQLDRAEPPWEFRQGQQRQQPGSRGAGP